MRWLYAKNRLLLFAADFVGEHRVPVTIGFLASDIELKKEILKK